jgi:hypothetical protein
MKLFAGQCTALVVSSTADSGLAHEVVDISAT